MFPRLVAADRRRFGAIKIDPKQMLDPFIRHSIYANFECIASVGPLRAAGGRLASMRL